MPDKTDSPAKRPARSGIYSWVKSKRVPSGRAFQKVRRDLGAMREELMQAHGGEKISPDAAILVDSVIEGLGVQKLLGLYVRKFGVVDEAASRRGQVELSPILAKNWISYANTVRQGILALKEIDKARGKDEALTPLEIAAVIDAEKGEAEDLGKGEIAPPSAAQSEIPESAAEETDPAGTLQPEREQENA